MLLQTTTVPTDPHVERDPADNDGPLGDDDDGTFENDDEATTPDDDDWDDSAPGLPGDDSTDF